MKQNDRSVQTVRITDIQRFCMHDGPGVRTTVFFKGCPLHCRWCHNPETQKGHPEILFSRTQCVSCGACEAICGQSAQRMMPERTFDRSLCVSCGKCASVCPAGALTLSGKTVTVPDILQAVEKDRPFYGKDGGLTVSGGEPTLQADALLSLLEAAKEARITTALETCGSFPEGLVGPLCRLTDLFLYDIKDTDAVRLKENTGADMGRILANLHKIDDAGCETVLRCILIPEVNMNKAHIRGLSELYQSLNYCRYAELLPYHPYGTSKTERLGMTAQHVYRVPEKAEVLAFAEELRSCGVPVKCFGTELPAGA